MQSLLRWSIENASPLDSAPSDRPPAPRQDLNPEIIDLLLGKPDAELMKEDVAVAVDASKSEDERIAALDHLEMLIEQIDNANNLEKLKLWESIHSLLTSKDASTEIKVLALWVIGTAVQNNPSAQDVYLSYNPLPTLLSFLTPSPESTVSARSKALYALSGLLKHNAPAVKRLSDPEVNGWEKIRDALQDPNIGVRRKAIFLLATLLTPTSPESNQSQQHYPPLLLTQTSAGSTTSSTSNIALHPTANDPETTQSLAIHTPDSRPTEGSNEPIHDNSHAAHLRDATRAQTSPVAQDAMNKHGLLDAVISSVVSPLPHGEDGENTDADHDFDEKALRLLHTYAVNCGGVLNESQKKALKGWLETEKSSAGGAAQLEEKYNLTSAEHAELELKLYT